MPERGSCLDRTVYQEVAADQSAIWDAAVAVAVAIIVGLVRPLVDGNVDASVARVLWIIVGDVSGWYTLAYVAAIVATPGFSPRLFRNLLRSSGLANVPGFFYLLLLVPNVP